ncbi:MAG: complement resistance protein TraT [Deltaproteobacteria bacterium]|nr:complement resistance protein TraT [Deltaproteobacteria bacterium]
MKDIRELDAGTRTWIAALLLMLIFMLSGCAAMTTAIEHRELEVRSKMSDTIFLDPVKPELKTVFLQIKNTSDKDIDIKSVISSEIISKGYRIESDPDKAHYLLQANVLFVGKAKPVDLQQALAGGYGGLVGGLVGAGMGHSMSRSPSGYLVGGGIGALAGGLTEHVANALVKNVVFSIVTDVQLSERTKAVVEQEIGSDLSQGSQTKIKQVVKTTENFKRFRTRVVSEANKVNLDFEEALPRLQVSIGKAIAGIL